MNSNTETEDFTEKLSVDLTTKEVAERADQLAQRLTDREVRGEEYREEAKANKAKLGEIATDITRLTHAVRDKAEQRPVACQRTLDFETGEVSEVRMDTGEVFNKRPITDKERQEDMGEDFG